jgi:hypothetical protein
MDAILAIEKTKSIGGWLMKRGEHIIFLLLKTGDHKQTKHQAEECL